MAQLSYFLRSKGDNATIYCRLTLNRKTQYEKKTGFSIDEKYWSKDKKLPKQTSPAQVKKLKSKLEKLRIQILERTYQAISEGKFISNNWLEYQINVFLGLVSETGKDDTVIGSIDRFINNANKRGLASNTIKKYKYLKTKFIEYQGREIFRVKDIDKFFADDFLNWLQLEKQLNKGTANKLLRNLITVCKEAASYEIETSKSFQNITTERHEKENKIYLTPSELLQIEKAHIIAPYLVNARKWLLLGCEIGQRVSDLPKINPENVIEYEGMRFLVIQTKKTNKEAIIPIVGKIEALLSDGFPRPIASSNLNKYIKEVCKIAGIDTPTKGGKKDPDINRLVQGTYPKHELITTHCMRYTFVTNSKNVINNQLIRSITTHASDKMMESYNAKEQLKIALELGQIWQKKYEDRQAPMSANQ